MVKILLANSCPPVAVPENMGGVTFSLVAARTIASVRCDFTGMLKPSLNVIKRDGFEIRLIARFPAQLPRRTFVVFL